jgi:hypothetical protein
MRLNNIKKVSSENFAKNMAEFLKNGMQILRVAYKVFFIVFNQNISGKYYRNSIFNREFYIRRRKRTSKTADNYVKNFKYETVTTGAG